MKITLTISEVTALVREHYNLPALDVEISDFSQNSNPNFEKLISILNQNDCLDGNGVPRPDKKIASIKLLRDVYAQTNPPGTPACGLCQAKTAVEDWAKFSAYVKRYGFPRMSGADPEGAWR